MTVLDRIAEIVGGKDKIPEHEPCNGRRCTHGLGADTRRGPAVAEVHCTDDCRLCHLVTRVEMEDATEDDSLQRGIFR